MFRITSVYDEGAKENTSLIGAKGFSTMIETGTGERILFDTGMRGRYLSHNLDCLGISPDSIGCVVISQNRPDNCGGLGGLLKERTSPADVYTDGGMFQKTGFFGKSLSELIKAKAVIKNEQGWITVAPGVHRTPFFDTKAGRESFMVLEKPDSLAIISGFGAEGPETVLSSAESRFGKKISAFIGSVYLEKSKKQTAEEYADSLRTHGVRDIYLNHSVGRNGITSVRTVLGLAGVKDFYAGYVYDF